VTARGAVPCCAVKKLSQIFNRVVRQYDGLQGSVVLDRVVCPACVIAQRSAGTCSVTPSPPHCFYARSLRHAAAQRTSSSSSSSAAAAAAANSACEQRSGHITTHRSAVVAVGGVGGQLPLPKILASRKILFLSENFLSKIRNFRLKIPHFGGVGWELKLRAPSFRNLLLSVGKLQLLLPPTFSTHASPLKYRIAS